MRLGVSVFKPDSFVWSCDGLKRHGKLKSFLHKNNSKIFSYNQYFTFGIFVTLQGDDRGCRSSRSARKSYQLQKNPAFASECGNKVIRISG